MMSVISPLFVWPSYFVMPYQKFYILTAAHPAYMHDVPPSSRDTIEGLLIHIYAQV